jgi:undecaprenyl phosphate-alpha-L-ara4N flippase subunit ArnF
VKYSLSGYLLAGSSVLLTTLAQLAMKWGMIHLPHFGLSWITSLMLLHSPAALLLVGSGIAAYLLSMFCWLKALHYLPLNKAYPLLSISYALVYLATALLPWYQESLSFSQTLGVILITLGVWLIISRKPER